MVKKKEKMRKLVCGILVILIINLLVVPAIIQANPLDDERENRLNFGHIIYITSLYTDPSEIIPGNPSKLRMNIENTGNQFVNDIRIQVDFEDGISFLNDLNNRKISRLNSGESKNIEFNIIAVPGTSEGVYEADITVDYVSHIGDERQDNNTLGIIVKSEPKIFAKIDDSEIHQKKDLGEITITFVNNDVGDIKFLTIELLNSEDLKTISSNKEYIGDLDSDDFESVDFRIKANVKKEEIIVPLKIDYRDSLNNAYSQKIELIMPIRSAKELGLEAGSRAGIISAVILVIILGYLYYKYRKKKKRKRKEAK
jgi:hypothetical protein